MQYMESRAAGSGPLSAIEIRLVTSSLHFMSYLLPKKGLPGAETHRIGKATVLYWKPHLTKPRYLNPECGLHELTL